MVDLPDSQYEYRYERPQAEVIDTCMICGNEIHVGEEYYTFQDGAVCEDCIEDHLDHIKREHRKVGGED